MTNFATMNRTTLLALRICAARLDPKLSHEHFAQLVADFRESAENDALERVKPVGAGDTGALLRDLGAIDDSSTTVEEERPASEALPAAERSTTSLSQESVGSATGGATGKRRLVTDADRAAIRADYLAALGTRKRVPRGTFERLVEKYGFAKTTLQSIVAKVQPDHDRDAEHDEPHTNSNGCWCRKGANNAANPWCTNKPGPKHVPGLTDPRGNKLNVSRGAMGPPNYSD